MARPANESALPFPPYSSFINFLNDLNAMEVLPNKLNQQCFSASYSGSAKHQVLRALRFFDLMNADGTPNEERLRTVMNPETRGAALPALLREKYKALIDLPLETASPPEFNGWFNSIGMDPATTGKAKSFFMTAAKENGIKMHSLVADRVARRGPTGPRKKRAGRKRTDGAGGDEGGEGGGETTFTLRTDQAVFHPAIDMFLREARKVTEGGNWTADARKFVIDGFTTQLDLFLPVAKRNKGGQG